jgi:hypothetical protein
LKRPAAFAVLNISLSLLGEEAGIFSSVTSITS